MLLCDAHRTGFQQPNSAACSVISALNQAQVGLGNQKKHNFSMNHSLLAIQFHAQYFSVGEQRASTTAPTPIVHRGTWVLIKYSSFMARWLCDGTPLSLWDVYQTPSTLLLILVAELKEEVERLRSIRECNREIDWWSHALPSPKQVQRMDVPQEAVDPLPSHHQAEGEDLREGGMVTGPCSRWQVNPLPASLSIPGAPTQ